MSPTKWQLPAKSVFSGRTDPSSRFTKSPMNPQLSAISLKQQLPLPLAAHLAHPDTTPDWSMAESVLRIKSRSFRSSRPDSGSLRQTRPKRSFSPTPFRSLFSTGCRAYPYMRPDSKISNTPVKLHVIHLGDFLRMGLETYHEKRRFERALGPQGKVEASPGGNLYIIRKHAASHFH